MRLRSPAAILLALAVLTACAGSPPGAPSPTASPARTSTPSTPTPLSPMGPSTPEGTEAAFEPEVVRVRGLPEQGVAVQRRGGVDLVDLDGGVVASLEGFEIHDLNHIPGNLVLRRGGSFFVLKPGIRKLVELPSRDRAEGLLEEQPAPGEGPDLPAPQFRGEDTAGHWVWAAKDPQDYDRVLAQWSGECEVPTAFFLDPDGGPPLPVTGKRNLAQAPESSALGWTQDGRAVVLLPEGACSSGTHPPGVYLFDAPGEGALLVRTVRFGEARMWGATVVS